MKWHRNCIKIRAWGVNAHEFYILLKGDDSMAILKDKKAIIIGDRDGIPGQAIAECAESAGAEVVFSSTECFV